MLPMTTNLPWQDKTHTRHSGGCVFYMEALTFDFWAYDIEVPTSPINDQHYEEQDRSVVCMNSDKGKELFHG